MLNICGDKPNAPLPMSVISDQVALTRVGLMNTDVSKNGHTDTHVPDAACITDHATKISDSAAASPCAFLRSVAVA